LGSFSTESRAEIFSSVDKIALFHGL